MYIVLVDLPYRTKFRRTKFSSDKIFRRTKYSTLTQIFPSFVRIFVYRIQSRRTKFSTLTPKICQFCPTKFCPIRYISIFIEILHFPYCRYKMCTLRLGIASGENWNKINYFNQRTKGFRFLSKTYPFTDSQLLLRDFSIKNTLTSLKSLTNFLSCFAIHDETR